MYLARDEILGRAVALKVLWEQHAASEGFVERFKREARSAAALSHPHIVSVFDQGLAGDGTHYMVMEYVPGGTLKERIQREGSLTGKEAAETTIRIARALGAAHARGVIHRDVKPQNIFLTEAGGLKVGDFGIARAAWLTALTETNLILGTPRYLSPEQAMGKPVGPASDLYSLGVVLYEMLTGDTPYKADSPVAIAIKHISEPPPPPIDADPRVPDSLNAVVLRLLVKDPAGRYRSAAELVEDLERVMGGGTPTTVAPRLPAYPPRGFRTLREEGGRRRRKLLSRSVAATIVAFVLLAGTTGWNAALGGNLHQMLMKVDRPSVDGTIEVPEVDSEPPRGAGNLPGSSPRSPLTGRPDDEAPVISKPTSTPPPSSSNTVATSEVPTRFAPSQSPRVRGATQVPSASPPSGPPISQARGASLTVTPKPVIGAVPEQPRATPQKRVREVAVLRQEEPAVGTTVDVGLEPEPTARPVAAPRPVSVQPIRPATPDLTVPKVEGVSRSRGAMSCVGCNALRKDHASIGERVLAGSVDQVSRGLLKP